MTGAPALGTPKIHQRAAYEVRLPIEDDVVVQAVRGRTGHHRHRLAQLTIRYTNGDLVDVRTSGPRINADGEEHARGDHAYIDWLAEQGTYTPGQTAELREDTPQWIRDVVDAHPWPGSPFDTLAKVWDAGYTAGDRDGHVASELAAGRRAPDGTSAEPTRNPYA